MVDHFQRRTTGSLCVGISTEVFEGENPAVCKIEDTPYETLEAAFAAAKDGETITLVTDCSGNGIKAPEGKFGEKGLTIDLGGHTYVFSGAGVGSSGTEYNGFQLLQGNTVTFKNGTLSASSEDAGYLIQNYSNLTLDNMTVDGSTVWGGYAMSNNNGDIVIKDSKIIAPDGGFAFDVCRYSSYPSVHVTVKGNSIITGNVEVSASGSNAKDGFSLMIEAGTLNGQIVLDQTAKAAMAATPDKAKVSKTTALDIAAPAGYKWVEDGETTSKLVACDYVSQIGDNKFETLEEAFAAAKDGDEITLLADCSGNGIKAPEGKFGEKGLTIDLGGHTYDFSGAGVGSSGTEYNGFQLLQGNTVTFKNGTLSASSEDAGYLIQNYSNLTLDNMTVDGSTVWGGYAMSNNNGDIVIKDSKIIAPDGGFAFDVCRYSSYPSVHVTVKGNSIITGNVEVSATGSNAKDGFSLMIEAGTLNGQIVLDQTAKNAMAATPDKAKVSKATSLDDIAAPDGYKWVDNGNETSTLTPIVNVAKIGEVAYETLEEAFAAAEDGQTITLVADCAGNGIIAPEGKFSTGLTIDLGGHTYDFSGAGVGSSGTEYNGFQLLQGNTVTFKNGTLSASSEDAGYLIQNYSNLTLDNMTVDGSTVWGGYAMSNNNGDIVIKDSKIIAPAGGFAFDVCRYSSYPSVHVTVKGNSIINGNVEVSATGSNAKDGFSLMIEAGTLSGDIIIDPTAAAAMKATPEKAKVSKTTSLGIAAPADFLWVNNEDGTSTLKSATFTVNGVGYETLEAAFAAAPAGSTVKLADDYDARNDGMMAGTRQFLINKNLTIDGQGHVITTRERGFGIGNVNGDVSSNIDVTFKDITIKNTSSGARCIDTRGKIGTLTLDNVTLSTQGAPSGYTQPLTIGGNQTDAATVNITNSTIETNEAGTDYYAIITFNPVNMTISGSTLKGWACIYAKGPDGSAGSAGSVYTITNSTLVSKNKNSGTTNAFGTVMIEDNRIKVDIDNSNINISNTGDQVQALVAYSAGSSVTGCQITLGQGNQLAFNNSGTGSCLYVANQPISNTFAISSDYFDTAYVPYTYGYHEELGENGMYTIVKD